MSDPVILAPTCNINCVSASPRDINCQTAYFWEELAEDFTMPAATGTASMAMCNSAHYVTGGYVWLKTCGWLEITAKPNDNTLTVRNNGTTGNVAALTVIPAETQFCFLPPPEKTRWLEGEILWNPSTIADGNEEAKEIVVTGAALGDFVLVSFDLDLTDLALTGSVTAADTVTAVLLNNTGGDITIGSAASLVRARVLPM